MDSIGADALLRLMSGDECSAVATVPPTRICFGSGSTKCKAFVGALEAMIDKWGDAWWRQELVGFAGCSGGAIVALAACMRLNVAEMRSVVDNLDLGRLKGGFGVIGDGIRVCSRLGALSGEELMGMVDELIRSHTGRSAMTFAEMREATGGRDLVVVATSLRSRAPVYFSASTTPNETVSAAIRASCAIPYVFDPVRTSNDDVLVDGALSDPLPVAYFDAVHGSRSLGLYIRVSRPSAAVHGGGADFASTLGTFTSAVVSLLIETVGEEVVRKEAGRTVIVLCPDLGIRPETLSSDENERLLECGREAVRRWRGRPPNMLLRRLLLGQTVATSAR